MLFPSAPLCLPQGAWFPRAQTLQWARSGLDQMPPSGHDVKATFFSSRGTPGNRQVFPDTEWVVVAQLCLTLCNPVDWSLPGSSVHGILQARILEWVAISFTWGSSQPRD